jgi:hypothetical protein
VRRWTDVTITDAAVHLVAPRRAELSCSTAPVAVDEAVGSFLAEHVTKGLEDGNGMASRFRVQGAERAEGVCRHILASRRDFVARSARLAKLLYDASRGQDAVDARVSDGALVVARCQAMTESTTNELFVALLKLDPNDAFRAEESTDDSGNRVVSLVRQPNTLPSPRERLQKGAFVRAAGGDYDALVVDKQRAGSVVSAYFLSEFLGLEHVFDSAERTKQLHRVLTRGFEDVKGELTGPEYHQLRQYLDGQVVGGSVDVDRIVAGAPGPPVVRERLAERVDADLPDRVFDTDAQVAASLTKRRHFQGANGLRVSVDTAAFDDMVEVRPPESAGEDWVVTIRTQTWREP